ncbi:MAG: CsbD family protein [Syntrophales bacterium LBB04]|nr:CsbD family protein [Syntrophales bacterium LBB04]
MKSSVRDKAEGTFHEAKGKAKEMAGKLGDKPELEAEGTNEKIAGNVQQGIGKVKKVLGK